MKKTVFGLILIISLCVSIFYGYQKAGFHEDEYYTYFSSNRSIGLYQPDREWQDRQTILDEFSVKEGEGFNYGLVKLVQSWDVHPPVYYYIFHTFCSLVPGVFSRWPGLITNLFAFALSFIVLVLIMERLKLPLYTEAMVLMFWGLNPQTISCNMLIRMYAWLTLAVFACAYVHIRLLQEYNKNYASVKHFVTESILPVMVVGFVGFLIQYFFIFFFFVIGFVTFVYILFFRKNIRNAFLYAAGCAVSLALAVMYYPASLHHMLGGYRGNEAAGSFLDIPGTWERLSFFFGLFRDFVFAGGLVLIVLILFVCGIFKMLQERAPHKAGAGMGPIEGKRKDSKPVAENTDAATKNRKGAEGEGRIHLTAARKKARLPRPEVEALTCASIGYFLLTSKTALLVGAASNRYEMPIYGLLILLIFMDADYILSSVAGKKLLTVFYAFCLLLLIKGHFYDRNILFLYPEDTVKIAYAAENSSEVAIVMFNPGTPQNVWRLTDELLMYPSVFYMDEENLSPITDPRIIKATKIILYAADSDSQSESFKNLLTSCPHLTTLQKVSVEDMWITYVVN
ncbi:MAG: hypothetical protein IJ695_09520 [Butyrivibrio sp.]|nr:hypothetical protein [Butyrivibrio sp.]